MSTSIDNRGKFGRVITGARLGIAVLAVCVTAARGAEPAPADDSNMVAVHTDAGDVTVGDVRANLSTMAPIDLLTMLHDQAEMSKLIQSIAAQKLALKEAADKNWDKRPEVQKAIADAIERARTDAILRTYIAAQSEAPQDYPSEAEVQAAYDAKKSALTTPKTFHYAQIFVRALKSADKPVQDKAAAKLADIQTKLKANDADFGEVAASLSDDAGTARRKGDVGAVPLERIVPELRDALASLKPGAMSAPIRTDRGWFILKLLEVTEQRVRSLGEVREEIRASLRNGRAEEAAKAHIDALMEKIPTPNETALAHLLNQPAK